MPPEITIFFVFVVAMFVQTSTGFGSALIAMSFLISLFGPDVARPLFAISFSSVAIVITYRYRHHLKFKKIWRIMLITIISIPIGVNIIPSLNPTITKAIFGVFVSAYALYSILGFKPARLQSTGWQWVAGIIGGMVSGAFNTSGPVYIVYGDTQGWKPFEFKGNLQALFFTNSLLTTTNHFLAGNITPKVLSLWIYAVPGIIVGISLGFLMDRFIKPEPFRKVVLVLLFLSGISLIIR